MAKFYRSEDKTVLLEVFGAGSSIENLKKFKSKHNRCCSRKTFTRCDTGRK